MVELHENNVWENQQEEKRSSSNRHDTTSDVVSDQFRVFDRAFIAKDEN